MSDKLEMLVDVEATAEEAEGLSLAVMERFTGHKIVRTHGHI
jgi:hypothetical protein